MSPERLLQHFDQIAEAPDAVPRLRRFILDLAVRGKLVKQNPEDEPASELLKRIEKENKKAEAITSFSADIDPSFEIPNSWVWAQIGSIAYVEMGQSPPSEHYNQSGDGLSFYQGKADFGKRNPMPRYWCSQPTKLAKKDDILISVRAPVGPTNVASEECCIGRGLAAIRPHTGVDLELFLHWLKGFEQKIAEMGFGTTFIAINKKQLVSFPLPLPPLAEQHRIVSKMDELMAFCDELEAAQAKREKRRDRLVASTLRGLNNGDANPEPNNSPTFEESARFYFNHLPRLTTRPEHIRQLRQTILNLAVRGNLVPQDPADEPASKLLKRIEEEKMQLPEGGKFQRKNRNPLKDKKEFPYEVPSNWKWCQLADLSLKIHYGYTASAKAALQEVRLLRITDIQNNRVHWESVPGCEIEKDREDQYLLADGDILIARTGGTIGKSFLVKDIPVKSVFASYLIRVQGTRKLFDRYQKLFFESPVYWRQLDDGSRGTGQPNVNGQTLGNMAVPLPPFAEQHRIVEKVDELMALCNELESRLTKTAITRRQFLDTSLYEALNLHSGIQLELSHAS